MDVLSGLIVVILTRCTHMSKPHVVRLKYS